MKIKVIDHHKNVSIHTFFKNKFNKINKLFQCKIIIVIIKRIDIEFNILVEIIVYISFQ